MSHDSESTMTDLQAPASTDPSEYSGSSTDRERDTQRTIAERAPGRSADTDSETALEADDGTDRCETCGATIGPAEYRLSWIVEDGATTVAAHYCSEACFPDERPGARSESTDRTGVPRDWSYCR